MLTAWRVDRFDPLPLCQPTSIQGESNPHYIRSRSHSVVSMLNQRLRRWPNNKTTLCLPGWTSTDCGECFYCRSCQLHNNIWFTGVWNHKEAPSTPTRRYRYSANNLWQIRQSGRSAASVSIRNVWINCRQNGGFYHRDVSCTLSGACATLYVIIILSNFKRSMSKHHQM